MEINANDAVKYVEITENWGLPTLDSSHMDQVFGPYQLDDGPHFLSYQRKGRRWSVKGLQPKDNPFGLTRLNLLEISEITKRLNELSSLERPSVTDPDKPEDTDLLVYDGWAFQWIYVPALMRWELAPMGRA